MIKLSVLVPTVPSRISNFFPTLMKKLLKQCENRNDVEILGFFDNKKRSVGMKRQGLLDLVKGEYFVFIDDDDDVSDDYIDEILKALYDNPEADCVVYDCIYSKNGVKKLHCKYGIEYNYWSSYNIGQWTGKPAHTMVYHSKFAKYRYSDMKYGEDVDWVKRACKNIKKQIRIEK